MIHAAGIMIISNKGNALFLKRGPGGDMPGLWAFPGGRLEDGEDEIQAAIRETKEEAGFAAKTAQVDYWTRTVSLRESTGAIPTPPPGQQPEAPPQSIIENLQAQLQAGNEVAVLPGDQVDFTTFIVRNVPEFEPILCDEHVGYAWASVSDAPQPLHPGCVIALRKAVGMNELDVAKAIRDGELTSPQRFGKFWLFAIRITGTGVAYRNRKLDDKGKVIREAEYVWREPDYYLTPEFLERCNGLPVVLEHPKDEMVDSQEFEDRTVGTCFLPYIIGDEVWCIAKMYDETTVKIMSERQMSTSPGVVFKSVANTMSKIDGHNLLIEGKPSLLDHIAICWQGVWDKGGEPKGVSITTRGDSEMTAEEMAAKAKADQEREDRLMAAITGLGTHVKDLATRVDSVQARFDEDEKKRDEDKRADAKSRVDEFKFSERKDGESDEDYAKRHDAEEKAMCDAIEEMGEAREMATDKAKRARKDSEDDEKKRSDARKDSEEKAKKDEEEKRNDSASIEGLRKQIEELKASRVAPKALTDDELNALGAFQARADSVYSAMGQRTPVPQAGQSLLLYRRAIAGDLKKHTKFKDAELSVIAADENTFNIVCDQIMDEALSVASSPANIPAGTLRRTVTRSDAGHTFNSYDGQPKAWMGAMAGEVKQAATKFNLPS